MRARRYARLSGGALLVCGAASACGDAPRDGAPGDTAVAYPAVSIGSDTAPDGVPDTAVAPMPASSTVTNPPSAATVEFVAAADSAAGDSVFQRAGRCFTCHGPRGEGLPNLGPDLADAEWLHGDGSLAAIGSVVANGIALPREATIAMPAFDAQLSPLQIRQVAAYVYTLSRPGATSAVAAPDTATLPPDASRDTTRTPS